ncbi:FtsX-like permease family protein [Cellulomonas denverensis]|uniref:FtsX-like permease family protein n=1 Tax=Cellulomonas denverensis TaxID=264297 RepID=UPI0035EF09E8
MTGLGRRPLFRAHARANLVLAVLIAVATALMAGSFTVLIAAGTDRYLPGVPVPADDMLSEGAMSVLGWTLALTLFTATSLVSSMTAFTIDARLPEIARLRLTGATGRQVSRSIVTEVMGIGLLGSLAGCLLGWPAGAVINALLVRTEFAPAGLDVTPLPWSPAVVLGLGLVITFFGARPRRPPRRPDRSAGRRDRRGPGPARDDRHPLGGRRPRRRRAGGAVHGPGHLHR